MQASHLRLLAAYVESKAIAYWQTLLRRKIATEKYKLLSDADDHSIPACKLMCELNHPPERLASQH